MWTFLPLGRRWEGEILAQRWLARKIFNYNNLEAGIRRGFRLFSAAELMVRALPLQWSERQHFLPSGSPLLPPAAQLSLPPRPAPVLFGILGRTTNANDLKDALDLSSQRTRAIASRVAQASVHQANGFALPIDPATGQPVETNDVDLESEMTSLADEQLRYEATEKLLEKTYAQLRTSIKDR